MQGFKEVAFDSLEFNSHKLICNDWLVLTGGNDKEYNPMTISWGQLGSLWWGERPEGFSGLPVATVYVRSSRHTKRFMDENPYFTLSVLGEEYRQQLLWLGSKSGRDYDNKLLACGLEPLTVGECTAVKQAEIILVCRKIYTDTIKEEGFIDSYMVSSNYPKKDFHTSYIGEIVKAFVKE